jgi:hypothetical protein
MYEMFLKETVDVYGLYIDARTLQIGHLDTDAWEVAARL